MNKLPLLLFALVVVVSEQAVGVEAQQALKKRVQQQQNKNKNNNNKNNGGGQQQGQQQEERGGWMAGAWKNGRTFSLLAKDCSELNSDLAEAQRTLSDIKTQQQQRGTKRQKNRLKKQLKFAKLAYCLKCASDMDAAGVTCEDEETADEYCANLKQTRANLNSQLKKLERQGNNGNLRPWKMTLITNQRNKVDTQIQALCSATPFS